MPVALTYPGVYVEELSSGVRTITRRRHVDRGVRRLGADGADGSRRGSC